MKEISLRDMYVRDLSRAPRIRAAIRRAARSDPHTATIPFARFRDDPMLLYSCCGLANLDGVTLILPAEKPGIARG